MDRAAVETLTSQRLLAINNLIGKLAAKEREFANKRTDMRYPLETRVLIGQTQARGQTKVLFEAWGVDMSYQGMGVLSNTAMLVGRYFAVSFGSVVQSDAGSEDLFIPVRVARCQALVPGMFRVGLLFDLG
ncbi:MAG: hypothetical protein GC164_14900 [Phycisphaera sp.]|nr:hypothetical protein [Phycisphaera sp.]